MSNKATYKDWAASQSLPLHLQPWWLDIACQHGQWDVALYQPKEQHIQAALPYYLIRRKGLVLCKMPPFTDYLGPYLQLPYQPQAKYRSQLTQTARIYEQLVQQLPNVPFFVQQYDPNLTNWLPWYWAGFRQTTHYTYRIPATQTVDGCWVGFKSSLRNHLLSAEQELSLQEGPAYLDAYMDLIRSANARLGKTGRTDYGILAPLVRAAIKRSCGRLLVATNQQDQAIAALFYAWDEAYGYIILSGSNKSGKDNAAVHFLQWHAIQHLLSMGRGVDFCGSILPKVEHAFRSYNAELTPFFRITKARNRYFELLGWVTNRYQN